MNRQFPTMYKRGSNNTILEWKAEVQNNNKQIDIFVSYGELSGNHTVRYTRGIEGKNTGKTNETTAWQQAVKDVESKIKRKRREGYKTLEDLGHDPKSIYHEMGVLPTEKQMDSHSTLKVFLDKYLPKDNTNLEGNIIPMKAQQYYRTKKNWTDPNGEVWDDRKYFYLLNPHVEKEKGAIITKFPTIIQPKINGVRAVAKKVNGEFKLFSKKGLEYNLPHITKFLDTFNFEFLNDMLGDQDLIFDGELYLHGRVLGDITSAVTKANIDTRDLTYIIFDIAVEGVAMIDRARALGQVRNEFEKVLKSPAQIIKSIKVGTDRQVQDYTDDFIHQGYEGSIQRSPEGLYQFDKRPQQMTKLKRIMDEEFTIIDVIPQEKDGTLGLFVCRTLDGNEVKVNPSGTEDFKRFVLFNKDQYIGKELTCWFYEYTEEGLPFHILRNLVRDYE
jgi:hypothetical protein